jgi:hypothetical protein
MKNFFKTLFHSTFPNYYKIFSKSVRGMNTLLDVGCGSNSPLQYVSPRPYSVGLDAFAPSIDRSRAKGIHDEYLRMNFSDIDHNIESSSFECVLANDVLEHLEKEAGLRFLQSLERIATKRVIIFTPNGFLTQEPFEGNPWQRHLSGWSVKEMRSRGYRVYGINGWKAIRGEMCEIKFRPKLLWLIISYFTQPITYFFPSLSYQIFCVKDIR